MRTEDEIRNAVSRIIAESWRAAAQNKPAEAIVAESMLDALRWVLGDDSDLQLFLNTPLTPEVLT